MRSGLDLLITNPRLVQTGLDLVSFASIVWAEVDYSVYTLRQASRRSWRIGQAASVEVTFLVYEGTLQAEALGLVAAKTRASLMVEGELPEEGLAALGGDGGDVFLALARQLVEPNGAQDQRQCLEGLFAEARRSEDEDDEILVGDDWDRAWEPDREATPAATPGLPATSGPLRDLPLFGAVTEPFQPTADGPLGKVVTFEELAHLLRRPNPRRRVVPENQLSLFGT